MLPLFSPLLCSVIENSLNHLIFSQQGLKPAYQRLKQQSLQIAVKELAQPFTLLFNEHQIDVVNDPERVADCQLTTDLLTLTKLRQRDKLAALIQQHAIRVDGDIQLLQHFASLIDLLEWDPTEYLAPYIGDVAAESIRMLGEKMVDDCRHFLNKNKTNVILAIQEEWHLSPSKLEAAHLYDQLIMLSDEVNSLSRRIDKLESQT